uniref:Uncharacterized protein n=1 Tax=Romanomermis culicivorax TaxID=13658 RepID=A0A915IB94_ROMCU
MDIWGQHAIHTESFDDGVEYGGANHSLYCSWIKLHCPVICSIISDHGQLHYQINKTDFLISSEATFAEAPTAASVISNSVYAHGCLRKIGYDQGIRLKSQNSSGDQLR